MTLRIRQIESKASEWFSSCPVGSRRQTYLTPLPQEVGSWDAADAHGFDRREARGPGCRAFSGAERSDRREAEKLLSLYPGVDHAREKPDESKRKAKTRPASQDKEQLCGLFDWHYVGRTRSW